jgi:hypothetical protein
VTFAAKSTPSGTRSGPAASPLEVIEQITYLLFLKRLDDLHTLEENKAARLKKTVDRRIFPEGADPKGRPYDDLRWSRFKNLSPAEMFTYGTQSKDRGRRSCESNRVGGSQTQQSPRMCLLVRAATIRGLPSLRIPRLLTP